MKPFLVYEFFLFHNRVIYHYYLQCSADVDFSSEDYIDSTDISMKVSGSALCCNSASASIPSFKLFDSSTKEVTISFYLKTCSGCDGVIFSYTKSKPFSLDFINNQIVIFFGKDKSWETQIELQDNKWYQIVFTYSRKAKTIVLYVFSEESGNTPQVYTITKFKEGNPFTNGGSLSLGKFQISKEIKGWKKTDSFVGCYDSLGFASR